jgi:hypothetical protein
MNKIEEDVDAVIEGIKDIPEDDASEQDGDNAQSEARDLVMSEEEMSEARSGGFNPFWVTKVMEHDKPYVFVALDNIKIRDIQDKFQGIKTPRMVLAIKEIATGAIYDLCSNKDKNPKTQKYSSLSLAMRRLYALKKGDIKGTQFSLTKTEYRHETWGETDAFNIRLIEPGEM